VGTGQEAARGSACPSWLLLPILGPARQLLSLCPRHAQSISPLLPMLLFSVRGRTEGDKHMQLSGCAIRAGAQALPGNGGCLVAAPRLCTSEQSHPGIHFLFFLSFLISFLLAFPFSPSPFSSSSSASAVCTQRPLAQPAARWSPALQQRGSRQAECPAQTAGCTAVTASPRCSEPLPGSTFDVGLMPRLLPPAVCCCQPCHPGPPSLPCSSLVMIPISLGSSLVSTIPPRR